MINVSNLSLRYGKRVLFEDVNLKFTPGVKATEPVEGSISPETIFKKVDFPAPLAPIIP